MSKPYTGQTLNGCRHGSGVYNYPQGGQDLFKYSGDYDMGVKKGTGKFVINGMSSYEGDFDAAGEMTGKGIRRWADGREYVGEFKNGEMNGSGTFTRRYIDKITGTISPDHITETYEGQFIDNKRHGDGKLSDEYTCYEGQFANNKFNGNATVSSLQTPKSQELKLNQFTMKGHFADNIAVREGEMSFKEGEDGSDLSTLYCQDWQRSQPVDIGKYSTADKSYLFKGSYDKGFLDNKQVSSYIWANVNRDKYIEEEEALAEAAIIAAGGKPGKKAPPKKGEEVSQEIEVPMGRPLGDLVIRMGGEALLIKQKEEAEAAANDPKAKKGKNDPSPTDGPLPVPVPPEGMCMPNEHIRRFKLEIKPALPPLSEEEVAALEQTIRDARPAPIPTEGAEGEDAPPVDADTEPSELSEEEKAQLEAAKLKEELSRVAAQESTPFWLRTSTQQEVAVESTRVPVDSIVYEEGKLRHRPPALRLLPYIPPKNMGVVPESTEEGEGEEAVEVEETEESKQERLANAGLCSAELALEEGTEACTIYPSSTGGSDVNCHRLPLNSSVSCHFQPQYVDGYASGLVYATDFKLDHKTIIKGHRDNETNDRETLAARIAERKRLKEEKAALKAQKKAEREAAAAAAAEAAALAAENGEEAPVAEEGVEGTPVEEEEEEEDETEEETLVLKDAEMTLMSFSRHLKDEEVKSSSLDLVMIIPRDNMLPTTSTSSEQAPAEGDEAAAEVDDYSTNWSGCTLVLRQRDTSTLTLSKEEDGQETESLTKTSQILTVLYTSTLDVLDTSIWHSLALRFPSSDLKSTELGLFMNGSNVSLTAIDGIEASSKIERWVPEVFVDVASAVIIEESDEEVTEEVPVPKVEGNTDNVEGETADTEGVVESKEDTDAAAPPSTDAVNEGEDDAVAESKEEEAPKTMIITKIVKKITKTPKTYTRLVYRCGGNGFAGAIRSLYILPVNSKTDLLSMTAVFAEWRDKTARWVAAKNKDWYRRACLIAQGEVQTQQKAIDAIKEERAAAKAKEAEEVATAAENDSAPVEGEEAKETTEPVEASDTVVETAKEEVEDELIVVEREYRKVVDVPFNYDIQTECYVYAVCGQSPVYDKVSLPTDIPLGEYVLYIIDDVPAKCCLTLEDLSTQSQRNKNANSYQNDLTAATAVLTELKEKLAAFDPPAVEEGVEPEPFELSEEQVVEKTALEGELKECNAKIAALQQSLVENVPLRTLAELGHLQRAARRLEMNRELKFKVIDPSALEE